MALEEGVFQLSPPASRCPLLQVSRLTACNNSFCLSFIKAHWLSKHEDYKPTPASTDALPSPHLASRAWSRVRSNLRTTARQRSLTSLTVQWPVTCQPQFLGSSLATVRQGSIPTFLSHCRSSSSLALTRRLDDPCRCQSRTFTTLLAAASGQGNEAAWRARRESGPPQRASRRAARLAWDSGRPAPHSLTCRSARPRHTNPLSTTVRTRSLA